MRVQEVAEVHDEAGVLALQLPVILSPPFGSRGRLPPAPRRGSRSASRTRCAPEVPHSPYPDELLRLLLLLLQGVICLRRFANAPCGLCRKNLHELVGEALLRGVDGFARRMDFVEMTAARPRVEE